MFEPDKIEGPVQLTEQFAGFAVPTIVAVFVVQLSPVEGEMEWVKIGDGLIVMVKTSSTAGQLFNCALTVIVPLMLIPVEFCGANHVGRSPFPEFPIPIEGLEFTHVNVAFGGLLWNVGGVNCPPGQALILTNPVITATGLTAAVALTGVPGHKEAVGVMV